MTMSGPISTLKHANFSPIQKYFNKPECKNLCVKFVLYTTYILLHIATIQKVLIARYFEIVFDRWRFTNIFINLQKWIIYRIILKDKF